MMYLYLISDFHVSLPVSLICIYSVFTFVSDLHEPLFLPSVFDPDSIGIFFVLGIKSFFACELIIVIEKYEFLANADCRRYVYHEKLCFLAKVPGHKLGIFSDCYGWIGHGLDNHHYIFQILIFHDNFWSCLQRF